MGNRSSFPTRARTFSLAVALAALGASPAYASGPYDGGGRIGDYLALVDQADASGAQLQIAGVCASACTMKLGARRACIRPDAELRFHAARNPDGRVNALATLLMMMKYPPHIRDWAERSGALESTAFTPMSGAQAIALGMRACKASGALETSSRRLPPA